MTANASLARQFERALDYWSGVLDLNWHRDDTDQCAIQLVDGERSLFESSNKCHCISARSQNPGEPGFEGWIAFNPEVRLTDDELYRVSVHEIGHLLGLGHNPDTASVMYFFDLDSPVALDAADLRALAGKHKLRDSAEKTATSRLRPETLRKLP